MRTLRLIFTLLASTLVRVQAGGLKFHKEHRFNTVL
jgi:hypothetical protein